MRGLELLGGLRMHRDGGARGRGSVGHVGTGAAGRAEDAQGRRGEGPGTPRRARWWRAADGDVAAPGEGVCAHQPLPPSSPAPRPDGAVLRLSPHPHSRTPALTRLPNYCI